MSNFSIEKYRQRFRIKRRGVSPSLTLWWASCSFVPCYLLVLCVVMMWVQSWLISQNRIKQKHSHTIICHVSRTGFRATDFFPNKNKLYCCWEMDFMQIDSFLCETRCSLWHDFTHVQIAITSSQQSMKCLWHRLAWISITDYATHSTHIVHPILG